MVTLQLEYRPLSFSELEGMLPRYVSKAEILAVIKEAMKRRLSGVSVLMNEESLRDGKSNE
jgi:hypothetical protein